MLPGHPIGAGRYIGRPALITALKEAEKGNHKIVHFSFNKLTL